MKTFRDLLKEELKDESFKKSFFRGLEKTRVAIEIVAAREKNKLTQKQLADLVGTSQSAIARMENADYNGYSLRTLRKIADALNLQLTVSLKELAGKPEKRQVKITKIIMVDNWPKEKGYEYHFRTVAELKTIDKEACNLS